MFEIKKKNIFYDRCDVCTMYVLIPIVWNGVSLWEWTHTQYIYIFINISTELIKWIVKSSRHYI